MNNNIFLYGGSKDPNFLSINSYIKKNNINYTIFTHNVGLPIDVIFDVNNNILKINNKIFDDKRVFIRNDIFSSLDDASQKLSSYSNDTYNLIKQFILFNEDIKILNRKFLSKGSANKVLNLLKAKEIGFLIPETLISSNIPQIQNFVSKFDCIQKPLNGGEYTKPITIGMLEKYNNDLPSPHKIQKRMNHPEIRVYRVGEIFLSFHIEYEGLDYRIKNETKISLIENDEFICQKLKQITDWLGLDYAASDFMTDEDGELRFLEVNSFPMFARFDMETNYAVSKGIVDFLLS